MTQPDYFALKALLNEHDIDADRVQVEGMTEDGYFRVRQFPNGRPIYKEGYPFKLDYEFITWPDKGLYAKVKELYYGKPKDTEPKIVVADKPVRAKTQPVKDKQ